MTHSCKGKCVYNEFYATKQYPCKCKLDHKPCKPIEICDILAGKLVRSSCIREPFKPVEICDILAGQIMRSPCVRESCDFLINQPVHTPYTIKDSGNFLAEQCAINN
jgi:hypothetical protein